jgi:hypothetical protein
VLRGTFGKNERFQEYRINAYRKSNPNIGPGVHRDQENFDKLRKKPCAVVMKKDEYQRGFDSSNGGASRSNSKSKSQSQGSQIEHQGGRRSESKSNSRSASNGGFIRSGNLL